MYFVIIHPSRKDRTARKKMEQREKQRRINHCPKNMKKKTDYKTITDNLKCVILTFYENANTEKHFNSDQHMTKLKQIY